MESISDAATLVRYAGFWRRFAALIIDYIIVSVLVFPIALLLGVVVPRYIEIRVPFKLLTYERVLSTEIGEEKHRDGSIAVIETKFIERTVVGKWRYIYEERIEHLAGEKRTTRKLIDPETKGEAQVMTSDDLVFLTLIVYWILLEGSRLQGSLGKRALNIKVVNARGGRLSLLRAMGRNLSKIFSAVILFIGFLMAGWTRKKQGLHDIIAGCYVILQ